MDDEQILATYSAIPARLRAAVERRSPKDLDQRANADSMSLRETVHHLTEANIVSASMMIAALGASGSTYDWSWLYPDSEWRERMGYGSLPVEPALDALDGLVRQITNMARFSDDALDQEVRVFDTPGGEVYSKTVREIISEEAAHADEHLSGALKAFEV